MDANKDIATLKIDGDTPKIEPTPATVFIDKVTADLPVDAGARANLEVIGKPEDGLSEVVKRNLKEVEKLGAGFVELYKKVIEENLDLADTIVYVSNRNTEKALGYSGIREINGKLETYVLMIDPASEINSQLLDKNRERIVEVVSARTGIAREKIDDEVIRKFIFLHELGHAKESVALDIKQQNGLSNAEVVERAHLRRRAEMNTLPVPNVHPNKVEEMRASGELDEFYKKHEEDYLGKMIFSVEGLSESQRKAYPELPSERVANEFARKILEKYSSQNDSHEEEKTLSFGEITMKNVFGKDAQISRLKGDVERYLITLNLKDSHIEGGQIVFAWVSAVEKTFNRDKYDYKGYKIEALIIDTKEVDLTKKPEILIDIDTVDETIDEKAKDLFLEGWIVSPFNANPLLKNVTIDRFRTADDLVALYHEWGHVVNNSDPSGTMVDNMWMSGMFNFEINIHASFIVDGVDHLNERKGEIVFRDGDLDVYKSFIEEEYRASTQAIKMLGEDKIFGESLELKQQREFLRLAFMTHANRFHGIYRERSGLDLQKYIL